MAERWAGLSATSAPIERDALWVATSNSAKASIEADALLDRRLGVVGGDDHRVVVEERVGPPAACMSRSSWRSAAAIDVTCACGPFLCE